MIIISEVIFKSFHETRKRKPDMVAPAVKEGPAM
ncbi:aspartate aminotransferase [Roseibium aggregatum IAM 12614]|uniref:Aspartate aminotransferase n=1 Tax=Roseibium aggregatum (strain ATCC 25650 / DSM 13394 / JCM 20685 / NBRC 16684 / NCIMB 2208 / IAM 12614 / B1) TaxID=384765 RepID=A0NRC5_ROSAI|nr:aspartate aminotransferase [Roseibium aggregatum IAM 12614]